MQSGGCVRVLILTSLLTVTSGTAAQELFPGMEKYLTLQSTPVPALVNHYDAALVAAYWDYPCAPADRAVAGSSDVALNYSKPAETGSAFRITGPEDSCAGRITAVVWADGNEIGDAAVLRTHHACRSATWSELHRTLAEDIFKVRPDRWDPQASVDKLEVRSRPFQETTHLESRDSAAVVACRANAIDTQIRYIRDYQSAAAAQPDKSLQLRFQFLRYLRDWEQALNSPIYPEKPIWWNWP